MKLKGKVALVTGGGTGIGRGVVERLAAEGASVAVAGVDVIESANSQYGTRNVGGYTAALALVEDLKKKGFRAIAVEADVTRMDQVKVMITRVVEAFNRLDILVNCAGVITSATVDKLTEEEWDTVMDVNAKGTFVVDKVASAEMIKQGFGKIVNFSSIAGKIGYAGLAHYCASKFAVIGFTKALAAELAKQKITVNAVCPGIVGTQMWKMLSKDFGMPGESEEESYERNVRAMIPQGEPQTAEDMAEAVVFLAVSDHVTGQAIYVDGGAGA